MCDILEHSYNGRLKYFIGSQINSGKKPFELYVLQRPTPCGASLYTAKSEQTSLMLNAVLSVHILPLYPAVSDTSSPANHNYPWEGSLATATGSVPRGRGTLVSIHTARQGPACRLLYSVPAVWWVQPK